uniref:Lon N-terminal domain-containing protein n=1 Tax=Timema tahoe TaxID=61484 RepID=A0A7R9ISA7_9NEOP|nr:unnamed protein product [Timema tahoe]
MSESSIKYGKPVLNVGEYLVWISGIASSLLEGHHNHGPIDLEEEQSIEKNGHFLTLLRFRPKEGDKDLESHLQSSNHNTRYRALQKKTAKGALEALSLCDKDKLPIIYALLTVFTTMSVTTSSSEYLFLTKEAQNILKELDSGEANFMYLGNDLEELQGRTMLDDDSIQTLALLPQPGVVLVPGQTLPLSVFYPPTVSMLRQSIATDRTFGVVCVSRYLYSPRLAEVGTTAEIYEFQEEERSAGFRVKAKGRQRFKILETHRQVDGNVSARVRILPEVVLPHSLNEIRLASLDRHQSCPGQKSINPGSFIGPFFLRQPIGCKPAELQVLGGCLVPDIMMDVLVAI